MPIASGQLRNRVKIQARPTTGDAYGQASGDYADVKTGIWAGIQDLSGRELYSAQAIKAEATVTITMRGWPGWRDVLKPQCRIVETDNNSRIFDVKFIVNPDSRDFELNILAKEVLR